MSYSVICFFFFKQKTAYEMRISDWSSDVCSSDLTVMTRLLWIDGFCPTMRLFRTFVARGFGQQPVTKGDDLRSVGTRFRRDQIKGELRRQIGRASCRERVCQDV